MIKRIICILTLVAAACLLPLESAAQDRMHTLKIYNWADYIDESVLEDFKAWYREQTGEDVEIIYQLFDINEIMLAKIERGHEDFDVVCPSDYIIERMLRQNLLLPISRDFGSTPNYIDANLSPYIVEKFNLIDGSGLNANDYAVGYMWGTTGILYNRSHVAKEDALTWNILRNDRYRGKMLIKDAFRDVYGPALIFLKQDELRKGEVSLDQLMYDSSDESIALVEGFLKEAKQYIAGWEADFGKEMMTKGDILVNLTWSGDAVWAIEEAAAVGVDLDYAVPREGSNVWFDGWVIPKYAVNTKAARYFINFLCRSDIAIRNMDEIGYVSAIGTDEVLESRISEDESVEPIDVSYFFGEQGAEVRVNPVQYPARDVVDRCAMMHDSGDRTVFMLDMWSRVKGDNMSTWMRIVVVLFFAGLLAATVAKIVSGHRKNRRRIARRLRNARKNTRKRQ